MRFDESSNRSAVQAAELVNLVDEGTLDAASLSRAWDVAAVDGAVDAEVLAGLAEVGRRIAPVFRDEDPRAVVNRLLANVRVTPHVTDHDDRGAHLHFEPPGADLVARFEANTLMGLAVLLCDDHERLGTCAADGCERAWVDTSRNARRRFCSTSCANRTHVAAHRARQRAG